eukprot:m.843928 g.843928  ORF g.843928 m.843928 type:complete len:114 (+) comp59540_c0_seq5:971-1312(+)
MGKNMDAIVVETEAAAMECVKYMRSQHAGAATFIPLNTIIVKPVNESVRSQYNLATDALEYDTSLSFRWPCSMRAETPSSATRRPKRSASASSLAQSHKLFRWTACWSSARVR